MKAFLGAAGVGSDLERPGPLVSELCVGVELPEAVEEESDDEETCVATDRMPSSRCPHMGSWGWNHELNF